MPGAGVVDRDHRAALAQVGDRRGKRVVVGDELVLGDLDHDPVEHGARSASLDEVGAERRGADVDRQVDVRASGRPARARPGSRRPRARRRARSSCACANQTSGRATVGVREARERLVADDPPAGEADDGLEGGGDRSVVSEQLLDLGPLALGPGGRGVAGVEAAGAALAAALGPGEGAVGELVERRRVLGVGRERGDPGGAAELEAVARGSRQPRPAPARRPRRRRCRVGAGQDQRELRAPDARRRSPARIGAAQGCADAAQHLVAVGVAVGVVDGLEVVEVEDHETERPALLAAPIQLRGERLVEAAVVGEPGERVGARRGCAGGSAGAGCISSSEGRGEHAHGAEGDERRCAELQTRDRDGPDPEQAAAERRGNQRPRTDRDRSQHCSFVVHP